VNKKLQKTLDKVKRRAEKLSEAKSDELIFEAKDDPSVIFEHIKNGHALELYCVANDVPETLDQKDAFGMTPLHIANLDQSGLATAILTEKPHASVWEQDNKGRIPLDVAEEFENYESIKELMGCTYPEFFKEYTENAKEREQMEKFDEVRMAAMEHAKTRPGWLQGKFRETSPELDSERFLDNEL